MPRDLRYLMAIGLALAPACKDNDGDEGGVVLEETTYWQHVAPIYFKNCVGCHSEGGIAPFHLDTFEDARAWAAASASAVANRTMPPWLMTADGSCGDFHEAGALQQDEIDTIVAWAAEDTPEGTTRDDLVRAEPPRLEAGLDLHTPNFVPVIQGGPLAEFDEYRCFLVEPGLDHDQFITGYDVVPGNAEIVHHVLAMPVDLDAPAWIDGEINRDVIEALDDESPDRDGWPCFSAAGEGVSVTQLPVTWAPGMGVVEFPEGTGVRLRASEVVVIQVHYNFHDSVDAGASDSTQVRLKLADEVEREGVFTILDAFIDTLFTGDPATIEPGQERATYEWTIDLGLMLEHEIGVEQADLYGIFPHMHERGSKWRAELLDDDSAQCIGEVKNWDFAWQLYYFFAEPPVLSKNSRLKVTCEYDTRGITDPITPGWGTQNEMCLAGLFVVP